MARNPVAFGGCVVDDFLCGASTSAGVHETLIVHPRERPMHMTDPVDEELAIMNERASAPPSISADIFHGPISRLCRGAARCVDVSATVRDAVELMQGSACGSAVVIDGGKLAGILTERDVLMKVVGSGPNVLDRPVTELMTAHPESLRREDVLLYLMNKMHVGGFRHVPIVNEEGEPLHVLSMRDVLYYILDHFDSVIANLPDEPYRGEPTVVSG